MIVNNFDSLSLYFNKLQDKEDFFYVQVIQRKKDGHRKSERIIRNFYIYSKEDFLKKKDYIIELCEQYNARAYFLINPRNARKIALECIKSYADLITQEDCTKGFKVWDKKCGANPSSNYDRRWIVDVDTKVVDMIQIFNGCHLITMGFDLHHFKQLCKIEHMKDIDVHKDNPTLLYYAKDGREDM